MKEKFILTLDQGTSSSRAIVFNKNAELLYTAQQEFKQIYPQPGWVEHDASEILRTQIAVAQNAMSSLKLNASDIAAIGVTNQRETTVIWDKNTGFPICNAIVWQDRRTAGFCDELKQRGLDKIVNEKTGLVIDAYFSGTKIAWILDNVPNAREEAEKGNLLFGTIDCWLIWNLTRTRNHVTDFTNASRTMLFNIHSGQWDNELLEILNIPKNILPEVTSSSEIVGEASSGIFGQRIPIAGIAGDQQSAAFGNACLTKGMCKNTYGTGCFMVMNTEELIISKNKLLTIPLCKTEGKITYGLEGSIFIGGAVVQWLRDSLGIINQSNEIEALAASVNDNGDTYLVPAFAGLGAPHWDQYARGNIVGITRSTTKAHIARAALESIAYQTADLINAMENDSSVEITCLRVDGGATANNLLMQFQADILNIPVERPKCLETTALGVAFLAGLAVGYWSNTSVIESTWQSERVFEPTMGANLRVKYLDKWHKALERAKQWAQ